MPDGLLQRVPVALPPTLLTCLGYQGPGRFVAFHGDDATHRQLTDGTVTRQVWMVPWRWWLRHPLLGQPTLPGPLLLDRQTQTLWTGSVGLLAAMLRHAPRPPERATAPTGWTLFHALEQMAAWLDHTFTRRLSPQATQALLGRRDDGSTAWRLATMPERQN